MTALAWDMSLHTALDLGGTDGGSSTVVIVHCAVARYLARQELVVSFYPDKRFIDALIEPRSSDT